jgi:hypothetical protein
VETTAILASTVVSLFKFDNQAGEFKPYCKILVPSDKLVSVVAQFSAQRAQVKGFYKYSWATGSSIEELYCCTPSVFDNIEILQS